MKSRALFFNPTLLKKNFFRYSVLWAIFTGLLFLCTSLPLLNMADAYDLLSEVWIVCSVPITAIYALICAACCFSYLNKTRSIYMMSAFPMTRTKLYFTTLLQGLLFGILPELVVTLFNLLIANKAETVGYIWQLLLVGILEYLFFYGMAVVCMVLTGKTAYGVFCYIVLSFGLYVTEAALRADLKPMLYGILSSEGNITGVLCPLIGLYQYSFDPVFSSMVGDSGMECVLGWYIFAVGAAGIVLMALGWLLYRKRQMENAGEAIAFRWLRPVCKYAFALFVSFVLGRVIMYLSSIGRSPDFNFGVLLSSLLIAGFVGYFCAEMMLKRSVRVFKGKAFLGYGALALFLIAVVLSAKTDLFGIVRRVPQKQEVAAFELISDDGVVLHYDKPEDIELMLKTHEKILNDYSDTEEETYALFEDVLYREFTVTYYLTDGGSFSRTYHSCAGGIKALTKRTATIEQYYDNFDLEHQNGGRIAYTSSHEVYSAYLNAAEMKKVVQYLEEDMGKITFETIYVNDASDTYLRLNYWQRYYIILADGKAVCIPASATKTYAYIDEIVMKNF